MNALQRKDIATDALLAMDKCNETCGFLLEENRGIECRLPVPVAKRWAIASIICRPESEAFHLTYMQRAESLSTKAAHGSLKFGERSSVHDTGNLG